MSIYETMAMDKLLFLRNNYFTYQNNMWDILQKIDSFSELFKMIYGYSKVAFRAENRAIIFLLNRLRNKFGDVEINYLQEICRDFSFLPIGKNQKYTEHDYQNFIIESFVDYFPDCIFIGKEYPCNGNTGRIDIFAEETKTGKAVIIELKKGRANATKQLLEYSKSFDFPRLICVTEEPVLRQWDKNQNIQYITYQDLNRCAYKRVKTYKPYSEVKRGDGSYIYYTFNAQDTKAYFYENDCKV